MREQSLVNLDKSLLVVDKEIKDVKFVFLRKVLVLDSTFSESCKLSEWFLELLGCLLVFPIQV